MSVLPNLGAGVVDCRSAPCELSSTWPEDPDGRLHANFEGRNSNPGWSFLVTLPLRIETVQLPLPCLGRPAQVRIMWSWAERSIGCTWDTRHPRPFTVKSRDLQEDACILLIRDSPACQSSLSSFSSDSNDRVPEQVLLTVAAVMAQRGARSLCNLSSMQHVNVTWR